MSAISIGEAAEQTGLSVDTLRYYEKIGLLSGIARDAGGRRRYTPRDLAQLAFIQRAQRCNFSLDEIRLLLELRSRRHQARPEVQRLTERKLETIEARIDDLARLRHELESLLVLCRHSDGPCCPILEGLDEAHPASRQPTLPRR